MTTKFYTLNKSSLLRIAHRTGVEVCAKCGEKFKEGDTVIRRGQSKKSSARYYHKKCFNSLYIEA